MKLHHVQLAIPRDSEDECRAFYCAILGFEELPKPPALAARGGLWLKSEEAELHLGVEHDFRPAKKAHPAFLVTDLEQRAKALETGGHKIDWDQALPTHARFYVFDAVGNRLEFMQAKPA